MSEDFKRYDLDEICKDIAILFADVKFGAGECGEVRMIDKKKRLVAAGWFDDIVMMAKAAAKLARDGFGEAGSYCHIHENVYWNCNPVNDALLGRQRREFQSLHQTAYELAIDWGEWHETLFFPPQSPVLGHNLVPTFHLSKLFRIQLNA